MYIVGISVLDNSLYSTLRQCYTQTARNQVCVVPVYATQPTYRLDGRQPCPHHFAESRKAYMPNRCRLLTPQIRKAFLWGLLRYQAKRAAFHAMQPLTSLRNYIQINDINTFDQNSCQNERFFVVVF